MGNWRNPWPRDLTQGIIKWIIWICCFAPSYLIYIKVSAWMSLAARWLCHLLLLMKFSSVSRMYLENKCLSVTLFLASVIVGLIGEIDLLAIDCVSFSQRIDRLFNWDFYIQIPNHYQVHQQRAFSWRLVHLTLRGKSIKGNSPTQVGLFSGLFVKARHRVRWICILIKSGAAARRSVLSVVVWRLLTCT